MPSSPPRQTWRSSAVPPGGAGPTAATDDVCTTRSTSARTHSSSTVRVPWTLMRKRSSAAIRRFVVPATWNTRSTPRRARRTARPPPPPPPPPPPHRPAVRHVGHHGLHVEPLERLEARRRPHGHADVVA